MPISPRASPIGLPALRASSCARSSLRGLERVGEAGSSSRARSAGATRPPRREGGLRARDRRVGLLGARARDLRQHLLGGRLEHGQRHRGGLHQRGDHRRALVGLRVPLHAEREALRRILDRLRQVVDRRPAGDLEAVADRVDALVVVRLGRVHALARDAARRASRRRAARRGRRTRRGRSRWSSWPTMSGRCSISVPPRATFITCMPRQTPSTGTSASSAAAASAISNASRSGASPMSAPPVSSSPSSSGSSSGGLAGSGGAGARSRPRAAPARRSSARGAPPPRPSTSSAPARPTRRAR